MPETMVAHQNQKKIFTKILEQKVWIRSNMIVPYRKNASSRRTALGEKNAPKKSPCRRFLKNAIFMDLRGRFEKLKIQQALLTSATQAFSAPSRCFTASSRESLVL